MTLSSDMTLIMAPQSVREEGSETPSTSVAILIVGMDLGREYSESGSDSTTRALTDDSFLANSAFKNFPLMFTPDPE